jgi:hypothetical protein
MRGNVKSKSKDCPCRFRLITVVLLLSGGVAALSGCGAGVSAARNSTAGNPIALSGVVHGGQQPVSGASMQLYSVGTQTDGANAKPLLQNAVQTDQNGNFSIALDYTCPTQSTLVYIVATSGNPGLASGTDNTAISMMAALGACSSLNASTYISVNELTTVGSIAALYSYMSSATKLGSGNSDAAQLANAFALVNEYVNIATGTVPGPAQPAGYYASSVEIQTLGDIVAACVNSTGGRSGDGSACGNLFNLATSAAGIAPKDTVTAIVNILDNPTRNVASIYDLNSSTGPFQPSLSAAPASWALPIINGPATPTFSLPEGTYSGSQSIAIASTFGAAIYYTLDGSTPTSASTLYTSPLVIPVGTTTVQAIAYIHSAASTATSAAYTITPAGEITVNANMQTAISAKLFGANNIWYYVQGSSFTDFAKGLKSAGVTGLRFPGGYEAEHYIWDQNSPACNSPCLPNDDDEYVTNPGGKASLYKFYWQNNSYSPSNPNAPWSPGATSLQASNAFPNNVVFVARTLDAIEANTTDASNPNNWYAWANYAAYLVKTYGYDGQDWLIGNEWYNDAYNGSDAHTDPITWANLYGTALSYYVPAMKAAAEQAGITIHIYASTLYERNTSQDPAQYLTTVQSAAGAAWSQVDGLDVHPYSGNNPSSCASYWITDPINAVGDDIQALINSSRKNLVFASEWSADLQDNKGPDPCNNPQVQKGLENANDMVQLFGQLAQGGVTAATYYPPVEVPKWGGSNCQPDGTCAPVENSSAQDGAVTLLDSSTYIPDANGQAMALLAANYRGYSLPVTVANSIVTSIAALNGTQGVVFVMGGGTASDETEVVRINGLNWTHVVSAHVLWYDPANTNQSLTGGPVSSSDITSSVSVVPVNGQNTAQFAINPGGPGRGSSWEIVMLVVQ